MQTDSFHAFMGAIFVCRRRLPDLRESYVRGTPERAALDNLVDAIEAAEHTLSGEPAVRGVRP